MKVEVDSFSGAKIYPGRGTLFVRGDSKVFRFQSSKSASLFQQRKNPRRISWTVLYRKAHKKGISEETSKRRSRKTVKHQRAIVGASVELIKERRSQKPQERKAVRDAKAAKDKDAKKAAKAARKANQADGQTQAHRFVKTATRFQKVQATSR